MAETNGHSPQQTSVFIAQPGHESRLDHKTSDNLLSPSPSTKSPRTFPRPNGNRKTIIIITACILAILILLVVVLAVTLSASGPSATVVKAPPPDRLLSFCPGTNESAYVPIGITYGLHHRCSTNISITSSCSESAQDAWELYNGESAGGKKALELAMIPGLNYSSVAVSPPFYQDRKTCTLRISYNFAPLSSVFYVTSHYSTQMTSTTSNGCTHGQINSKQPVYVSNAFRVVVVSESTITPDKNARFTVTSHECASFESIARRPVKTNTPDFAKIPTSDINTCSLEIVNQTSVACDWWNVDGLDNGTYTRGDSHPCVEVGVGVATGNSHFLRFEATGRKSRALLVSPVIEGGGNHVIFSFWYLLQCDLLSLSAYVVPYVSNGSSVDIWSVDADQLVLQLRDMKPARKWTYVKVDLLPPKEFKKIQIIIDGNGTVNSSCAQHYCSSVENINNLRPTVPLIALDDLVLESVKPQCNITETTNISSNLSCSFQNKTGNGTLCMWSTISPGMVPIWYRDYPFYGYEWKPANEPEGENLTHGPNKKHFEDRGHVLLFDATGIQNSKFWSPLLVSSQSCSCNMSMLYLLRGIHAPRLKVNFVFGNQQPESVGPDKRLPRQTKWSAHGHQSEEWIPETIVLNLEPNKPFVIEITVDKPGDSLADAAIDDLFFHGCDLHLAT